MHRMKSFILMFIILYSIWILLTGLQIQELIAGGITVFLISLFFMKHNQLFDCISLSPRSIFSMITFLLIFLWELFKSNIDVAFRVLSPKLPINPGIVEVRTTLKSKLGRAILANAITLTPGTLTVETDADSFFIHWIDVSSKDINESTDKIVSKFEKHLEVIFG